MHPAGLLGRTTFLAMTLCQNWRKTATNGPKAPFRSCTDCGVNTVLQYIRNRSCKTRSASTRFVQQKHTKKICAIFFLVTSNNFQAYECLWSVLCSVIPVGGHAVEARHGGELWHLPLSELSIRVFTTENLRAFRADQLQVVWDDRSTVPGWYCVMLPHCCFMQLNNFCCFKVYVFFVRRTFTSSLKRWPPWWRLCDKRTQPRVRDRNSYKFYDLHIFLWQ